MERIITKEVKDAYKSYMGNYGIETNWKRHNTDVRDGLKNVQRRILDSLALNLPGKTKFIKTSRVIGDTIGTFHPHGDSSVKTAIKPMVNWFDSKMPLIQSESNMGSMQGATDAAARYTEIKLSEFAKECVIAELSKAEQVVDWRPNYDNTTKEPEYLPVSVPLLLINGSFGIGVGMKVYIPPHNFIEVLDATIKLIKNPNYDVVLIPDFCMPVDIIDADWKSISRIGHGKFSARAVIDIEEHNGCYWLIIKSIPHMVYFDKGKDTNGGVKYDILKLVAEGKITQIADDIKSDSTEDEMRIIIKLKRGSDPEYVRQMLYKYTDLEKSYTVNMESTYGVKLTRLSYKRYLEIFIEQTKTKKYRYSCIMLQECKTKIHELDAYIKIIESGKHHHVIDMVYNSKSTDDNEIIEYLIKNVGLTDIQAKFIINLNIKNISSAKLDLYKKEMADNEEKAQEYLERIVDDKVIEKDIIKELEYFKKKYGSPRTCRVIPREDISSIPKGTFKLVITENNYIKKLSVDEYVGSYRGDNPKHVLIVDNTENVLLFSAQGRVFNMPVHKIPLTDKGSIGIDARIAIKNLVSDIQAVLYVPALKEIIETQRKHYITVVSHFNHIKKMDIEDFFSVPQSGLIYTKLSEGDTVSQIRIIPDDLDVIIYSDKKALRVPMENIPKYKRSSLGDFAMKLKPDGHIDGISVIYPNTTDVVVVTEKGRINKFPIAGLARSARYTAGSNVIRLTKGDKIKNIYGVHDGNKLVVYGKNKGFEINISDLKLGSSVSTGEKLITNDIVINSIII